MEAFREHRLLSFIGFLIAGKCPQLDTEFADMAAETYPLKTKLRYECDNGYRRRSGISLTIRCQNISGTASWVYDELVCIGFCGMPKTVPHASLSIQQQYSVGQVLHFKCLTGYNKQLPESGIITCKNVNGRIIWTPRDAPCTSNSSPVSKQLSPLIEAVTNEKNKRWGPYAQKIFREDISRIDFMFKAAACIPMVNAILEKIESFCPNHGVMFNWRWEIPNGISYKTEQRVV
ncbi:hypothetical protein ASZ78_004962 [Callipepla squamata]|uniref:Interleukin-2 receptor subunit alpha n=1 Tax=Callipepla squamata TaxID=9009 RepID=A0A226NAM7_CALSU|nr:hypothetical protein ASZ78_004962 [Callipepla squamata]